MGGKKNKQKRNKIKKGNKRSKTEEKDPRKRLEELLIKYIEESERRRKEDEEWKKRNEEWIKRNEEWRKEREEWERKWLEEQERWKKEQEQWRKEYERWRKEREEWEKKWLEEQERREKENEKWKKEWTRKWGEISNRLGTIIEDFVIPNIKALTEQIFGKQPKTVWARISRTINGETAEFDVVVEVDENYILLNETKSKLSQRDVKEMKDRIKEFRRFFPEFRDRKIVPILTSLWVDRRVINFATKNNVYVAGLKGEEMSVLNLSEVKMKPKPNNSNTKIK